MLAAGESGLIGLSVPEEFGGAGMLQDYRFRAIVNEEVIGAGAGSLAGAFGIQDDLAVPYLVHMGTQEQKEKWLPGMATGEILGALAMSEPGAGSDLRGIKTTAKKVEGGYIVNGAKTFISSGKTADVIVTFVKTGEGNRPDAFSLLLIENGMDGFDHGKKLHKMGFQGHDTAELSFSDVFVPEENLISGKEGQGFIQLMMNLPLERLSIGVAGAAAAEAALKWTLEYTKNREAFGERIIDFQNTRFKLADVATTVDALWAYIDRALLAYKDGKLTRRRGREGQVLDDRARVGGARHLRAAARRLRLHHRVPDRPRVPRRARAPHLRRHERDHARDRRPPARRQALTPVSPPPDRRTGIPVEHEDVAAELTRIPWFADHVAARAGPGVARWTDVAT